MTKKQKKEANNQLEFNDRNYWLLDKKDKKLWLDNKGKDKKQDIVFPILWSVVIPLLAIALCTVFIVGYFLGKDGSIFKTKIALGAACGIGAMILGVGIWFLVDMKKKKIGFWIHLNKGQQSEAQQANKEIEKDRAIDTANALDEGNAEVEDLEL